MFNADNDATTYKPLVETSADDCPMTFPPASAVTEATYEETNGRRSLFAYFKRQGLTYQRATYDGARGFVMHVSMDRLRDFQKRGYTVTMLYSRSHIFPARVVFSYQIFVQENRAGLRVV